MLILWILTGKEGMILRVKNSRGRLHFLRLLRARGRPPDGLFLEKSTLKKRRGPPHITSPPPSAQRKGVHLIGERVRDPP